MKPTAYYTFRVGEVIPAVRMTQKSLWNPRSQRYLANKNGLSWEISGQMAEHGWQMLPAKTPLWLSVLFIIARPWSCDTDNLVKTVCDAMNGIVYPDDRWIASFRDTSKAKILDGESPFAEIVIGVETGNNCRSRA